MMNRDLPIRRPAEGWSVLLLVAIMAIIVGWAIDDPAWVNGRGAMTDSLALCGLLGAAIGLAGPKLGWGRWTTHGIGALFAGLVVPILAGGASAPGSSISEAFHVAAVGSVDAYLDLAWRGLLLTDQEVHYTLTLGGLVWGTMQFASYAVFGHHRPLGAVLIPGLVLVVNMALTARDQLPYLMEFVAASLLLLVQLHAFDERVTWARRQIGDPGQLSSIYLRGGTVFIVVAIGASLLLTDRAASAPLAGAWTGVTGQLLELSEELARFLPAGGDWKGGGGVSFGSSARVAPRWFSDDGVAFTAVVPSALGAEKWRAATYDSFEGNAWTQTSVTTVPVEPGLPLLGGLPEEPDPALTSELTIEVRPDGYYDSLLLSPGTVTAVGRSSNLLMVGEDGWFAGVDLPGSRDPYTIVAAVFNVGPDGITENKLRAASRDYPAELSERYTQVPDGTIGPEAARLLGLFQQDNPYDLARAMESYLRSSLFQYSTDVTGIECGAGTVECFAATRTGYCLHYASTMAILLREAFPDNRVPTRLVQGFLPGALVGSTQTVVNRNAHAWVEVYFPGYGWIPFDPTGGDVGRPVRIPVGAPVASGSPTPAASRGGGAIVNPSRGFLDDEPGAGGPTGPRPGQPGDPALLIVFTILLALAVVAAAVTAWLRGPRGEISPDAAWRTLSRTASRLGFAPRPTQTVYEYTASLGQLVPAAEEDLQTVAVARVETVYARTTLPGSRLRAVREASRRLRISMLRLLFRREGGRRR